MTTRLVLACNTCEVIGPTLVIAKTITQRSYPGRPKANAATARDDWTRWFDGYSIGDVPFYDAQTGGWDTGAVITLGHAGCDVRLIEASYDGMIPLPGWMPRPLHGPADCAGRRHLQVVACPACRAVYQQDDPTRRAVSYQTADHGTKWFLFCRSCRHVWGEAAREREVRSELTRSPLGEALWDLQRQGIHDEAVNPRLPVDAPLDTPR